MEKVKSLKGTKTEQNLMAAFAGESQARNKYTYYASAAKKEGYEQIAAIFEETAGNEKEHAKMWFKYLHGGSVPKTMENLKDAAEGENYEWTKMYKQFAEVILLIATKGISGKTYPLGSGNGRKLSEYVEDIRQIINPSVEIRYGVKEYYPHQPMYLVADISELKEDTGWAPKMPFQKGISILLKP